jgi:predicted nucleic acid-binding protein
MSGDIFLDTNILVYATLGGDRRCDVARSLLRAGGTISVQVLNEFAATAHRKLRRRWSDIAEALAAIRVLCREVRPIDVTIHEVAIGIAERDGLSFYDALIVASALDAGSSTLLTEDMQHGRRIGGRLDIRNPFLDLVEA